MNVQDIYGKCPDVEPKCKVYIYLHKRDFYDEKEHEWCCSFHDLAYGLKTQPVELFKVRNGDIHALICPTV